MPRVLVVEDEPLIAVLLEAWLLDLGCEVFGIAKSNAEALQLISQSPPDVAILDLKVADGDSYPVAHELRSHGVPFVFATGYDSGAIEPEFRSALVVKKPFDFSSFEKALCGLGVSLGRGGNALTAPFQSAAL